MNAPRPRPRLQGRRAAFTLVEVIISLGIFLTVMAMAMGALTSMTSYTTQEGNQSDMVIQGRAAVRLITNDIANSSWLYDFNQTSSQLISTAMPNTLGYSPPAPYQNNPLLPWVWIDGVGAYGSNLNSTPTPNYRIATAATITTGSNVPPLTSGNPAWEKDTFEYLKVRTADNVAYSPNDERYEVINQTLVGGVSVTPVTTLDKFQTAPATPFMIVNDNYPPGAGPNDIFVSHVWEASTNGSSTSSPGSFVGLNFNQNMNPACLRHYHLEVINAAVRSDNPAINTGTLVRTYWNGTPTNSVLPAAGNDTINTGQGGPSWNANDQQILLYNVESFVVRTIYQPLTNTTLLQPNQVSITIVIQDPTTTPGVYTPQTISFITAMRSLAQ